MAIVANRGVELVASLVRHDGADELDHPARPADLRVEVGAGEAEDAAHVVRGREKRVDDDPLFRMAECQHERPDLLSDPPAADQVRALVPEERLRDHLQLRDEVTGLHTIGRGRHEPPSCSGRDELCVALEVREGRLEVHISEDLCHESRRDVQGLKGVEGEALHRSGAALVHLGTQKLDLRPDADRREGPSGHRVEEGARDLRVPAIGRQGPVLLPDPGPELGVEDPLAESGSASLDRPGRVHVVEHQAARGVALHPAPITALEASLGPARDGPEVAVVAGEGLENQGGHLPRKLGLGSHPGARPLTAAPVDCKPACTTLI